MVEVMIATGDRRDARRGGDRRIGSAGEDRDGAVKGGASRCSPAAPHGRCPAMSAKVIRDVCLMAALVITLVALRAMLA